MKRHLRRLLDKVAPVRPPGADRGYRRLLRWAALPLTDRRWAAPLSALALGFGLFAGVAIGPGTTGTLATGTPRLIELPSLLAGDGGDVEEAGTAGGEAGAFAESTGGGESEALPAESGFAELEPEFAAAAAPSEEATTPAREPEEPEAGGEPEAEPVSGVVVHANPAAGSYTIAAAGGVLEAIHAPKPPRPGARVAVAVGVLANGTLTEVGKRKLSGSRARATIAGTVSFVEVDPAAPAYAVSKRGTSVLIRVRPDPSGAPPALPQLGAYATVVVDIEKVRPGTVLPAPAPVPVPAPPPAEAQPPAPACAPDPLQPPAIPAATAVLWQSEVQAGGAPFASSDFAGVVMAICPSEAKLLLSADDLRQSGRDIALTVPRSIDLTGLEIGDSVLATADFEAGGGLGLTGLAGNERRKGADDATATQGDLASRPPR